MPNHLLFSISSHSLGNWDVCKEQQLWGAPKLNRIINSIVPGDRFIVWLGGRGVKAWGTVTSSPSLVPEGTPSPWPDGRPYPVRFGITIDREVEQAKAYRFPNKRCAEIGLSTLHLQQGICTLQPAQFEKMTRDAIEQNEPGHVAAVTEQQPPARARRLVDRSILHTRTHDEVQYLLIRLGRAVGCDVWVARNDRNKIVNGQRFSDLTLSALPRLGFEHSTLQIVELIDVLWLQGSAIRAAFEIEHTTGVYSGLLRMSDLLTEQPNASFDLFIVASEGRRAKVIKEINRPTFSRLLKPLPQVCKFIPYEKLPDRVRNAEGFAGYVQYVWIHTVAELCSQSQDRPS